MWIGKYCGVAFGADRPPRVDWGGRVVNELLSMLCCDDAGGGGGCRGAETGIEGDAGAGVLEGPAGCPVGWYLLVMAVLPRCAASVAAIDIVGCGGMITSWTRA